MFLKCACIKFFLVCMLLFSSKYLLSPASDSLGIQKLVCSICNSFIQWRKIIETVGFGFFNFELGLNPFYWVFLAELKTVP